jgi:chromosome segregation ATPase
MHEKAIEALMDKEQTIINLQAKLEETENFYKEQVVALSNELQMVYQQRDEQTQAIVQLEKEAEHLWEQKVNQFSETIRRLQIELELREREIEEMGSQMEVRVNERVHEKMISNYELEKKKKEEMLIDTLSQIDDRDAVIRKAQIRISELSSKLGEALSGKYILFLKALGELRGLYASLNAEE